MAGRFSSRSCETAVCRVNARYRVGSIAGILKGVNLFTKKQH
ncbi:hypothetical protein HMPREF9538_04229 [Klebsiella sp. MS 92-3]|nr:hypothetical protein HMPREF9538_04229 [Klebsiella sp. MS 92-3]